MACMAADPNRSLGWHTALQGNDAFSLSVGEEKLLIWGSGGVLVYSADTLTAHCLEDREYWAVGGRYLVTDYSPMSACPGQPRLWKPQGNGWKYIQDIDAHEIVLANWTHQRTLLLEIPWRLGPPWGYTLRSLPSGKAPSPQASPNCYTRLQDPQALLTFSSGAVVVIGARECPENLAGSMVVESFSPGKSTSIIERLPIMSLQSLSAPSADNIWLAGPIPRQENTWLVYSDGQGWSLLPLPMADSLLDMAWEDSADGDYESLWLLGPHTLWQWQEPRSPGGGVEPYAWALPEQCAEPTVVQVFRHHLWLVCANTVFTTDPQVQLRNWPWENAAGCQRNFRGSPQASGDPGCGHSESPFELRPGL